MNDRPPPPSLISQLVARAPQAVVVVAEASDSDPIKITTAESALRERAILAHLDAFPRRTYARSILRGERALSGSDLTGTAAKVHGSRYAQQRRELAVWLLARCPSAHAQRHTQSGALVLRFARPPADAPRGADCAAGLPTFTY